MTLAYNDAIKIACERSDEALAGISVGRDSLVDVNDVLAFARRSCCPDLTVYVRSFTGLGSPAGPCDTCGAMTRIEFSEGGAGMGRIQSAAIVLNSTAAPWFQRFSLAQQVGHLVTLPPDAQPDPDSYTVSTRISCDLTSISREEMERDRYLLREQAANVFALRVLMPSGQFFQKIRELDSVERTARFYRLPAEAVVSRMMTGE